MSSTATTTIQGQPQVEWNLPEGVEKFSEGHVYHAYRTGINEGAAQDQKLFDRQLNDNSKLAANDTLQVISYMKEIGINPISAHLKIISRYDLKVLITVSDTDFAKESFIALYENVNKIQSKSKTDFYSISFTFINRSDKFDDELLQLEGFLGSFKPLNK